MVNSMKKCLSVLIMLAILANLGIACLSASAEEPELLGSLSSLLEPQEGSDYLFYSQLNNSMGDNRLVYDENHIYFCWGNSLYCAEYNGDDFWELTDTLRNNTSIALSSDKIFFDSAVSGSDYFASIKKDGSEIPIKIISFASLDQKLYAKYTYWSASFYRIVAPYDDVGNLYLLCRLSECFKGVSGYDNRNWAEMEGIIKYNSIDNTFESIASWQNTYYEYSNHALIKNSSLQASWIQANFALYDSAKLDGIRYKDRVTGNTNVISNTNPKSMIVWNDKVYFIERDTNKLYRMSNVGSQKKKLFENVKYFVINENGLIFYTTEEGLFAADQDGKNSMLITDAVTGRFYLLGDWIYWFGDTLNRLNCHTGEIEIVFDPAWL